MTTVGEILDILNAMAPCDTAEEWDNVGLQVGARNAAVTRVLVCLDLTEAALREARNLGAELIVTHHPVIFEPLRMLHTDSLPYRLAAAGIACISMHTNLDKAQNGVNDCLCAVLGLLNTVSVCGGLGRVGDLPAPLSPDEFAANVKAGLQTPVRVRKGSTAIARVGVVCGGGGSMLADLLAEQSVDAFVSGEIRHHEWLAVGSQTVVEAGHYATENVVVRPLAVRLNTLLPAAQFIAFDGVAPYETV